MMWQSAASAVNESEAPIKGVEQALQQTLGRLANIDAEFQAKVEYLEGLTAPLPEKARLLRRFEDACRRRRELYTASLAALQRQLRTRAGADGRGQSPPESRRHVPAVSGQQPIPTPSLNAGSHIQARVDENHTRSITKAISWRLLGSLDTLVLSYVITRNVMVAGSIAAVETATKISLYYVHERAWSAVRWGRGTKLPPNGSPGYLVQAATAVWSWCRSVQPAAVVASAALILCFAVVLSPRTSPHKGQTRDDPDALAVATWDTDRRAEGGVSGPEVFAPVARNPEPPAVASAAVSEAAALTPSHPPVQVVDGPQNETVSTSDSEQRPEPSRAQAQISEVSSFEATQSVTTSETVARPTIAGTWAVNAGACRSRPTNFIPAVIDNDGARAGETFCAFKQKRHNGNGLSVVAACSNSHERWVAKIRLVVDGDRLKWSSQRGSQTYVRCGPTMQVASRL